MILIVDYRNEQSRLLLAGQGGARSFIGGRGQGFVQLEQVLKEMSGQESPGGVAVVLPGEDSPGSPERLSWSTVRAAVSMANSLAFAWGVPAVRVPALTDDELVARASEVIAAAEATDRVSAFYDGEPNITKPKK
jgi:hypothetical protein